MFALLIKLLIRIFFQRPAGIRPGQKAGDISETLNRLAEAYCAAHGKPYRRPRVPAPRPMAIPADDFDFSL